MGVILTAKATSLKLEAEEGKCKEGVYGDGDCFDSLGEATSIMICWYWSGNEVVIQLGNRSNAPITYN